MVSNGKQKGSKSDAKEEFYGKYQRNDAVCFEKFLYKRAIRTVNIYRYHTYTTNI